MSCLPHPLPLPTDLSFLLAQNKNRWKQFMPTLSRGRHYIAMMSWWCRDDVMYSTTPDVPREPSRVHTPHCRPAGKEQVREEAEGDRKETESDGKQRTAGCCSVSLHSPHLFIRNLFFFFTFVNFQGGAEEPCVCDRAVSKVGRSRGPQEEWVLWEVRKDL